MRGSILFVCAANVCRSPLMQYTFAGNVADRDQWSISSAGISPHSGRVMCEASRTLVPSTVSELAVEHRSQPVSEELLTADLVIVASRAERSAVARRSPGVRDRLFTLSEAVILGRSAVVSAPPVETASTPVARFATLLEMQRGTITLPRSRPQRRILSASKSAHPLDIRDGHVLGRAIHRGTLKRVVSETDELVGLVQSVRQLV